MAECSEILKEEKNTGQLNKEEKAIISSKIAQDYRKLARRLSFEEPEITTIQHECDANGRKNPEEYCIEFITRWEQKEGHRASKERMKQALTNISRQDVVEKLCDKKDVIPALCTDEQEPLDKHKDVIPALCTDEQESLDEQKETQRKLESAQLKAYKEIEMEIAPWMKDTYLPLEKLYVELQMFSTNEYGNEDNGVLIDIEEIFNPTEGNTQPRRILVEGDAGFGKTTLLNKLVDDWTKKKDYICNRFRNVFLFYLRDCNDDQSFEALIGIECKSLDVDEKKGLKCIYTFEKETLFLLDGYDELSDDSKSKFENLLLRNKFKQATIIFTSRRGELQREKANKNGPGLSVKHRIRKDHIYIWDKRILISGISEENRIKFLQKYLQIENLHEHFHIADKELFRCPLFLILLATVKDEGNEQMIETQTDFYKFLLNVVTRRSLVRIHELNETENVELFDSNHENYHEECAKQMDLFGSLAIQHLIKDRLTFTQEEIEECCGKDAIFTKLGFINRRMTFKNWNRKSFYEPFHKSFLEFFAAFSLYRLAAKFDESDQEKFKKKISDLVSGNIIPNKTSLIYPFLAGLLNTKSSLLFDALSPWGCLWNIFEKSFLDILIEAKMPETLISSLVPFIPPILHIDDFFVSNSKEYEILRVLFHKLFSFSFKFHKVYINYPSPFQIRTKNCEFQLLDSEVNLPSFLETRDDLPVIECENLMYTLSSRKTNIWQHVIKIFLQTKFKTLAITLEKNIVLIPLLHKELIDGCCKNLDIDELTIEDEIVSLFSAETYFSLDDLVQNKKIKNIKFLSRYSGILGNTNKIFDHFNWECLNHISIWNQPDYARPMIPFGSLCQSLKKWKIIDFGNLFDYSLTDSSVSCSVEEIILDEYMNKESCEFVLKHCSGFTTLECDANLLDACLSTKRLLTLQDLRLSFYRKENFDWTTLLVLPRLRAISIHAPKSLLFEFENSLTFFVYQSELEILNLDGVAKILSPILQSVFLGFEKKQKINKTEILSIDSKKDINPNNCFSNLKSLEINLHFFNDSSLTQEKKIISLCKQFLKKYFVKEIILKYHVFIEIEFIHFLLISLLSEGFLLSRDKFDNVLFLERKLIISLDPKLN